MNIFLKSLPTAAEQLSFFLIRARSRFALLVGLALICFIQSACVPLPIPAEINVVKVRGRVVDSRTLAPVQNATINVAITCVFPAPGKTETPAEDLTLQALTSEDGTFELRSRGTRSIWFYMPLIPPFPGEGTWGSTIDVTISHQQYEPLAISDRRGGWQLSTRHKDWCRGDFELGDLSLRQR